MLERVVLRDIAWDAPPDARAFAPPPKAFGAKIYRVEAYGERTAPLALWLAVRGTPAAARLSEALRPYRAPATLAALQIAALSAALVRDGAPTHHPERATLVGLLVLALVVGDAGMQVVRAGGAALRRRVGAAAVGVACDDAFAWSSAATRGATVVALAVGCAGGARRRLQVKTTLEEPGPMTMGPLSREISFPSRLTVMSNKGAL